MAEDWLKVEEAAEIAGYHPNYVRKLLRDGKVNGRKWGQTWQVSRQSLLGYLEDVEALGKKRGPKIT